MLMLLRYGLRFLLMTAAILLVVVALLTGMLRLGLPYMSTYKNEIQAWAGDYLGAPVEIGSLSVAWGGLSPRLALDNVALYNGGRRPVDVRLEQIQLDLNLVKSLFSGEIHTNEVTISGADLSLEYFGRQQFKVSGYGFADENAADTPDSSLDVISWLMNASRVGLLNSRIKLIDRVRGIDYVLDQLNIRAENTSSFHQLRIDLQLPDQLGESLEIGLDLTGSRDTLSASTGDFYVNAVALNLQNWAKVWPQRSVDVRGVVDSEIWGSWGNNLLQSLRTKIDGQDIVVATVGQTTAYAAPDPAPDPAEYPTVESDLTWQRSPDGWVAEIDQFEFAHDQLLQQIDNAVFQQEKNDAGIRYRASAQGSSLQLAAVTDLLATLEATPSLRTVADYANGMALRGELRNWKFDMERKRADRADASAEPKVDPKVDDVPLISLTGEFSDLASTAHKLMPGVRNLTGLVAIEHGVGNIKVHSSDLVLQDNRLFPDSLTLATVDGTFGVNLGQGDRLLQSDDLSVRNNGLEASARFLLSQRYSDVNDPQLNLELQSDFSLEDVSNIPEYLPTGILRPRLKFWLDSAFVTGAVTAGKLKIEGDPRQFPFANQEGSFTVNMAVENAAIRFRESWPIATEVNGTVSFVDAGVSFNATKANIGGTTVTRMQGHIDDMRRAVLTLEGANQGPLSSFLKFANSGPLKNILAPALTGTRGTGQATMDIGVAIPLRSLKVRPEDEKLVVNGLVFLKDNTVISDRFGFELESVKGAVGFSANGVTIQNLNADYQGSRLNIGATTKTVKGRRRIDLAIDGLFRVDRVLNSYQIPASTYFDGPSRWSINVRIPFSKPGKSTAPVTLTATSDLVGTAVTLPEPVVKNSGKPEGVTVTARFEDAVTQVWRITQDQMTVRFRVKAGVGMQSMAVSLGQGKLQTGFAKGIRINGSTSKLAFDGWIRTVNEILDEFPQTGKREPVMPIFADVRVSNMTVSGRSLGPVSYRVNSDGRYINGVINNAHLRGNIRIPRNHWDKSDAIRARIAYADQALVDALKAPDKFSSGNALDPREFPRLDIHLSEVALKLITLRSVGIRTEPDVAGLRITAFGFANEVAQMVGKGIWRVKDPQNFNAGLADEQYTRVDVTVQSSDAGATLAQFGIAGAMAEGAGSVRSTLAWSGPAYKPDIASMDGSAVINLENGRLLQIEPGAAKLVGLFALQELPRRLSLDFRDVVNDGLDFQSIAGSTQIKSGVATTDLLRLKGAVGVIDVSGISNLNTKTFDQNIQVLPRISAALPIIGLLSGGATAGIGALLATPILKALGVDFDRIGLTEYSLTGSWNDPKLTRLQAPTPKIPEDRN